jgi:hypothetical protein
LKALFFFSLFFLGAGPSQIVNETNGGTEANQKQVMTSAYLVDCWDFVSPPFFFFEDELGGDDQQIIPHPPILMFFFF